MFDRLPSFFSRKKPRIDVRPACKPQAVPWPVVPNLESAIISTLRTGRGNRLSAGADFVDMQDDDGGPDALLGIVPNCNRNIIYFLAEDLRPITIRDDGLRADALSAHVVREPSPGAIRLRHPLSPGRFLAVSDSGAGGPNGCVLFNGLGNTPLDLFTQSACRSTLLPSTVAAIHELCTATASLTAPLTLLGLIRDGRLRAGMIEAVMRAMPQFDLAFLATHLLQNDAARDLLASRLPGNAWFSKVLPDLAAWDRRRESVPGHALTSPASDEFAGDGLEGHGQVQAGFAVNALARAMVRPRQCACLLASAKNEGPYLLEWIAYHQSVGFEHIFLYTNDNQDGSDTLLDALSAAGVITLIRNEVGKHFGPQYKAHSHALAILPQILDFRWCALLDLDEYFCFDTDAFCDVQDFLKSMELQGTDAVALCWQLFAARRTDAWRDEGVPLRFHLREPQAHFLVKSVFKPQLFWHSQPHFPYSTLGRPFIYRTELGTIHHYGGAPGRPAAHAENPSAKLAWINHYIVKTAPEALSKLARGYGDWNPDFIASQAGKAHKTAELRDFISRTFVNLADKQDLVEDRRILRCARNTEEAVTRLRALPGVREAEIGIKARFQKRLSEYCRAFASEAAGDGEPHTLTEFRAIIKAIVEPRWSEAVFFASLMGEEK